MLEIKTQAPPFALPDQHGRVIRLDELLACGPLVLYFYPRDFTPVCTAQACTFRDRSGELGTAGVQVVGVSAQGRATHERFTTRHHLGFPLLSDPDRSVARAYRATALGSLIPRRVSYLIDATGVIVDRVRADLRIGPHERFIERALRWSQAGMPDLAGRDTAPTTST